MKYAYDTGSDTHLTVRVPIPVPGYGTATLPVSVAAPCISGNVRLDGRFENCSFSVSTLNFDILNNVGPRTSKRRMWKGCVIQECSEDGKILCACVGF